MREQNKKEASLYSKMFKAPKAAPKEQQAAAVEVVPQPAERAAAAEAAPAEADAPAVTVAPAEVSA